MADNAKEINHFASGAVLVLVGVFGIIGAVTGTLANMLAALWTTNSLYTSGAAPGAGLGETSGKTIGGTFYPSVQGQAGPNTGANI